MPWRWCCAAFEDPDIATAGETVAPLADLETLDLELILADLGTTDRRIEKVQGQAKAHPRDFAEQLHWLAGLRSHLNAGQPAVAYAEPAHHPDWTADFNLLTAKPRLYVINVAEDALPDGGPLAACRCGRGRGGRASPAWRSARRARPSWRPGRLQKRPRIAPTWAWPNRACTS